MKEPTQTAAGWLSRWWLGCGVLGALLWFGGEMSLYGAFGPGSAGTLVRPVLATIPFWRVQVGAGTAPVAALLYLLGFAGLVLPCARRSPRLAAMSFGAFVTMAGLEAAYHSGWSAYAFAYRALDAEPAAAHALGEVVANTRTYLRPLLLGTIGAAVLGFGAFAVLTLRGRTPYPRAFVLLNPALLALVQPLTATLPTPLGRPLAGGFTHLSFLLAFIGAPALAGRNTAGPTNPGVSRTEHPPR